MTVGASPLLLVIVPTHSHLATLEFSVGSALRQSVSEIAVAVIGDGVSDETRHKMQTFANKDKRVLFFDFPKSPSLGEEYRDDVIRQIRPQFITYLGDDDLLLPHHCETMLKELRKADFVHPQPVYVTPDGHVRSWFYTDLSLEMSVRWHVEPPWRNSISLTGATHSLDAYLGLPEGWTRTPENRWTDHYMWQKFFRAEGLRFRTAPVSTTIKFPAKLFTPEQQGRHIRDYFHRMGGSTFRHDWDQCVAEARSRENLQAFLDREQLQISLHDAQDRLSLLEADFDSLKRKHQTPIEAWKIFVRALRHHFSGSQDRIQERPPE